MKSIDRQAGFTLLEVLLSSFIFMSVVTIAVGSFTSQITLQSSTEAQQIVQQTSQSIVESISRDVRTATTFSLPGTESVLFTFADGSTKEYRYSGGVLQLCRPNCENLYDPANVQTTSFQVGGVTPNANPLTQETHPYVTLELTVKRPASFGPEQQASISIRTLVSSRLFEKYR